MIFVPERLEEVRQALEGVSGVEVYGWNEKGEMVVVYEAESLDAMEEEVKMWPRKFEGVVSVSVAYLNTEDEVERIERGEFVPKRPWSSHEEKEPS